MNVSETIGKKIKGLMDSNDISLRQMAEIIGVTHPTMSKYISGVNTIDSEKLMAISNYFKKSFDYFFTEDTSDFSIMFRAEKLDSTNTSKYYENIIDKMNISSQLVESELTFIPQQYIINLGNAITKEQEEFIENIANEQRRAFDINNSVSENYFNLLASKGINLLCYPLDNKDISGASSYSEKHGCYIFVNTHEDIPYERQIFSLIHELGHLIFHRKEYLNPESNPYYKSPRSDIREKLVNSFAGYFLMPRELVTNYIEEKKNNNETINVVEMKKHFKVSIQALYVALHKYGLISSKEYSGFWKWVNREGYKDKEPEPLEHIGFEKQNAKLITRLMELYNKDEITINKIAELFSINATQVTKMINSWNEKEKDEFNLTI